MKDELVEILSTPGPVTCIRPEKSREALQQCIRRNYVHLLFEASGTELSMQLFRPECRLEAPDAGGVIRLVGTLNINYQPVKCVADINSATCEGTGYLTTVSTEAYQQMSGK
ncbi:MbtH domain protein [Chitinophaga polysaccharea]|uniref:MbtH domain protein n=1 Tax=Chitinophaga TaxID=79328 RepID=UPI001455B47C|nr:MULTISPECIES: MbtH domain protein [Chitinophaga]NLR57694.1 MbtH domain protein [Chitinophaga polysaccharea]NLU93286.1 MbtH domain protein [Chitinophaga sp. Ak27]